MSRLGNLGHRLHRGEVSYDFVGRRKLWYGISILITVTALVGLLVNGLNKGIEFSGGAVFTTPKTSVSTSDARTKALAAAGGRHDVIVQKLGTGGLRIQVSDINGPAATKAKQQIADDLGVKSVDAQVVGPSWARRSPRRPCSV